MEEVVSTLLAAVGLGVMWWRYGRRARRHARSDSRALAEHLDEDAQVILHVAAHEAEVRQQSMAPLHLLFALVQDEEIAAAIRAAGGDAAATEDRIRTAVDAGGVTGGAAPDHEAGQRTAVRAIRWSAAVARQNGRRAGRADLWAGLVRLDGPVMDLVRAGGVRAVDVLCVLVHGSAEEEPPADDRGAVQVVLVNDDFSTKDVVVEILRDVFDLAEPDARARMEQVHRSGQAVVNRYPAALGCAKVAAAIERARSGGFPLRIRIEPAA